jgi:hypothetical protein
MSATADFEKELEIFRTESDPPRNIFTPLSPSTRPPHVADLYMLC